MSPARSPRKSAREQVTLEFANNAFLAALGGAHQKNFVRLEQKLGVRVAMRGNLVAVEGAPEDANAPPRFFAPSTRAWKQAKKSAAPKWMPKSASPRMSSRTPTEISAPLR